MRRVLCVLLGLACGEPKSVAGIVDSLEPAYQLLCTDPCPVVDVDDTLPSGYGEVTLYPGHAEVRYDSRTLAATSQAFGPGAVAGILAHEYGHVLSANVAGENPDRTGTFTWELHADRWAGCLLAVADIRPEPYQAWLKTVAWNGGDTHPPGDARAKEAASGFRACGGH